jgi:hypothetical protein
MDCMSEPAGPFYPPMAIGTESYTFSNADFRARALAGKPAPTPEFARKLLGRFVDAEPTMPEFVNELASRQADADFARREAQAQAAVVVKVREVFNVHVFTPYGRCAVDPADCGFEFGIDDWDAWADHVSEIAVGVFVDMLRNPPTRITHADGHTEIRWPEGEAGGSKR